MRQVAFAIWSLILLATVSTGQSQTTTISYQSIPSLIPTNCLFNSNPAAPINIGGLSHYGIVGGVAYTGNELALPTNSTGDGSGFGIYYPFSQNYKYTIIVRAKASATSLQLLWAISPNRSAIPSSCAPGFPNIITGTAVATSSLTNLPSTYADYTLIQDFTPASTGVNYLLFSDYTTGGTIGSAHIQTVTIIATPLCFGATLTGATPLGNLQVQITFTPPAFNGGINNYDVRLVRYEIIYFPFPVLSPVELYTIPNVGTTSPVTITVRNSGTHSISMRSQCGTETVNSTNSIGNVIVN